MIEKFSTKRTDAEVILKAVTLKLTNGDVNEFFMKEDKLYTKAKFNDQGKFGLIREAIKDDETLLQFIIFRGCKNYAEVKGACFECSDNQKVLIPTDGKPDVFPGR